MANRGYSRSASPDRGGDEARSSTAAESHACLLSGTVTAAKHTATCPPGQRQEKGTVTGTPSCGPFLVLRLTGKGQTVESTCVGLANQSKLPCKRCQVAGGQHHDRHLCVCLLCEPWVVSPRLAGAVLGPFVIASFSPSSLPRHEVVGATYHAVSGIHARRQLSAHGPNRICGNAFAASAQ